MSKRCWLVLAVLAACGPSVEGNPVDGATGVVDARPGTPDADPTAIDASPGAIDAHGGYTDANYADGGCAAPTCPSPVGDGCDTVEHEENCGDGTGDGLDNDCNGLVDDGCPCTSGDVRACFAGSPGYRDVGACTDGTMRCEGSGEFTHWGPCTGGIVPTADVCDSLDNDCNGCADDNPACCTVTLACPASGSLPEAAPFTAYTIDARPFYTGAVTSYTWTVTGGPCDVLLSPTGVLSYTLNTGTPGVAVFTPTLSGDYTFTVTIHAATGETMSCTFVVHVRGPGLRVELCWDTTGDVDVDLHLHRSGTTQEWMYDTTGETIHTDDCFYADCTPDDFYYASIMGGDVADWGYADSDLAECVGSPGGSYWEDLGACTNPRLDMDNIGTVGKSENINLDNPNNGDEFRIMVHYYGGTEVTHPMVNIYCGGTIVATYGASPDVVGSFDEEIEFGASDVTYWGDMWRVADVAMAVSGGVTTGCTPTALHPGSGSGYWLTQNSIAY
jgi:hypothetical protein